MERKRILTIIQIVALVLQFVAEAAICVIVLQLNILPAKYLSILLGVMALLLAGSSLFAFVKVRSKVSLWRRIVSCVLALLIAIGCAAVFKMALDAYNLLDNATGEVSNSRDIYVLVRKEDPAQSLKDTKQYQFGALQNYDTEFTKQMIAAIEKETEQPIALTYYQQSADLANAIKDHSVDAIIANGVTLSLLTEQEAYANFLEHVRILHTLTYTEESKDEPDEEFNITKTPFALYISGSDTRGKKLNVSRSDVNILAVINPVTKQVLLVNTPRDTLVPNSSGDGALDKLTHCGNYGIDCSMDALESLYDVDISYYGKINFYGFEAFIDAIGGITVHSDQAFTTNEGIYIKKGENKLNGEQALSFSRDRKHVSGGDHTRGKNQMRVIQAVIEKVSSSKTLISKYADILDSLEGMLATNLTLEDVSALVKMQLGDMASWNVQSYAITGKGDMQLTYSDPGKKLSVMWPNEDAVAYANTLIAKVTDGEVLTEADMTMPEKD